MSSHNLGLGDPSPYPPYTATASATLLDACLKYFPRRNETEDDDDAIQVAIIGKPNVGKSSLTNRILGQSGSSSAMWRAPPGTLSTPILKK